MFIRRLLSVVLLCVPFGLVLAVPSGTAAAPTSNKAEAAAGWLARQLVGGDHFETDLGGVKYPDQGLTIDAIFAFAAAGVADDSANSATSWLARPEIASGYLGEGTERYAGAHAKLLLATQVRGVDSSNFGGLDVAQRLRSLEAATGRFSDASEYGDYSNVFGQSLAIVALGRTADGISPTAVDFLASVQCANGAFPVQFGQPECHGDVDATTVAVQALHAAGRTADVAEAVDWLVSVQASDGGFIGGAPAETPNSNSTGLAAAALRLGNKNADADEAVAFVSSMQQGCATSAEQQGAVALDASGFDVTKATRATAQAVLGLAGANLATLSAASAGTSAPTLACDGPGPSATPTPTTPSAPSNPATTPANVNRAGAAPMRASGAQLPRTGVELGPLVVAGVGLLLVGAVGTTLLATTRRRRTAVGNGQ